MIKVTIESRMKRFSNEFVVSSTIIFEETISTKKGSLKRNVLFVSTFLFFDVMRKTQIKNEQYIVKPSITKHKFIKLKLVSF